MHIHILEVKTKDQSETKKQHSEKENYKFLLLYSSYILFLQAGLKLKK